MWTPVLLEWEDAFKEFDVGHSEEIVKNYGPCNRRTLGFLIHADSRRVTITMHDDRGFDQADGDCDNQLTVPRGMVQNLIPLKPL